MCNFARYSPRHFDFSNQDDESNDADSFTSSSSDDTDSDEQQDDNPSSFLIAGPNSDLNETFMSDDYESKVFPDANQLSPTHMQKDRSTAGEGESNIVKRPSLAKSKSDKSTESANQELSRSDNSRRPGIQVNSQLGAVSPTDTDLLSPQPNPFDHNDLPVSTGAKKKSRAKHAAVIGRVAKTVKSSTVITGKHVIKHSKNLGKGTVSAGRELSSVVYNKQPRKHEPRELTP